jgi:hypothetical protein
VLEAEMRTSLMVVSVKDRKFQRGRSFCSETGLAVGLLVCCIEIFPPV